jgi:Bacterial SH3 domain
MSKIALATAVVALTAAVPLTMGRAEAQQLAPGAAPPWGTTTMTTTTETQPVPTPPATPATQPMRTSVEAGITTPIQGTTTPIQGTTTPIRAVSLRSGPNTGSPVIGTLRPGMVVQVLASANYGWMQVETPAGSGWAYGSYFAPVGSTIVVQHPEPPEEAIVR